MKKLFKLISLIWFFYVTQAVAHPHAFITMKSKPLVKDQQLTGFTLELLLDEMSSSSILYDLKNSNNDKVARQKLVDEVIENIINEHYFSYAYDKQGKKIKFKRQPQNYGMKENGMQVLYYFDFLLAKPQPLKDNRVELLTYDKTYYVSMMYDQTNGETVDFSALPQNCQGTVIEPNYDEKIQEYAASLDRSQRNVDSSLGIIFAQKVNIDCK
ncbi:zinc transporter binding subunit ZevA [Actinobacillus seminis]|uniref:zinc transporter binding subunit ZevA n=1 Tax=Actinobacillus seminis TaxID=722 RepID=UPI002351695A|nr:zinc transporter binding subunit ZevA [Actinobacillus seminis]